MADGDEEWELGCGTYRTSGKVLKDVQPQKIRPSEAERLSCEAREAKKSAIMKEPTADYWFKEVEPRIQKAAENEGSRQIAWLACKI